MNREELEEIIFDFSKNKKQSQAFRTEADESLYGGSTRGGKTYLSKGISFVCCNEIPGFQLLITRKFYADVITNFMEGDDGFRRLLAPFERKGIVRFTENSVRWTKTGSLITLAQLRTDEDVEKAQGTPKHGWIVEEACQQLERHIRFVRAWVTMDEKMRAKIPKDFQIKVPFIRYTANPIGESVGYFRRGFVKPAPEGTLFTAPEDDGGKTRIYIRAMVSDNPFESTEETIKRVKGMGDEGYYKALIEANWDAPIGDYFKEYNDDLHSIIDHRPPEHAFKFLTFDWGSAEPFAVVWWYVSDGQTFRDGLNEIWTPRGTLVAYREWYGCDPSDQSKGLHMTNEAVAKGIIDRTFEKTSGIVLTDSLPFQARGYNRNGREYRISDEFAEHGVILTRGNTQRVYGWKQIRDRLIGLELSEDNFEPLIRFQHQCVNCRDYIPMLGYHKTNPEDAQDSGEATHIADIVRLACASKPIVKDAPPTPETIQQKLGNKTHSKTAGNIAKQIIRKNRNARR